MASNEREENAYTLGVQAGLWGYPLAHRVEAFPRTLEAKGARAQRFRKFDRLKTADDRFVVTPNNLTVDAYAILDLADGPVVLNVPKLTPTAGSSCRSATPSTTSSSTSADRARVRAISAHRPGLPGPGTRRHDPGRFRTKSASPPSGSRSPARDLPAPGSTAGLHHAPLPDYLRHGIRAEPVDYGPIAFPELSAPDDLVHFDRLGAAMQYMLPTHADVNDTFVQTLGTIGLSVRKGFDWQSLDESTLAGLRRAAPVIEQITDERWRSISETVNGWRGSLASGRCSYDWALNAANTKNQVGTEVADQVVYVNTAVDADEPTARRSQQLRPALRTRPDTAGRGHVEHRDVRRVDAVRRQRDRPLLHRQHHRRPHPEPRRVVDHLPQHAKPRR